MPNLIFELVYRRQSKDGKVPLAARIIFKRKKQEKFLIKVNKDQIAFWDPLQRRFNSKAAPFYNKLISDWQQKFDKFISDNYFEIGTFDVSQIVKIFDNNPVQDDNEPELLQFLEEYYKKVLLTQFDAGSGTPRNFNTAFNILQGYLKVAGLEKILLKDFDKTVFVAFHESMTNKNRLPKPMKPNSAGSVVKKLRPAFNRAVLLKLISENPTYGTKIVTKNQQKPRLDISELKRIYTLDCSSNYSLDLTRNVFLLCCFTGFSIKDVMGLTKQMLLKRDDGEIIIRKKRDKSNEEVLIFLHKYAQDILDGFAVLPELSNSERLVPKRVGEFINRQLKIIGAKATIPFNLSTHIGRHTFRQLIREAGVKDLATIKKMMGHAPPRDIDSVYNFVTSNDLKVAKKQYENYLKKHL